MFVFFAALLSTASAANICCSPDQWQANVGLIMGSVNGGKTTFVEGSMTTSYDAVNKIIAYDQMLVVNNYTVSQRIVMDHKNGAMYTIRDGECNRTTSDVWVPYCIPDNATMISEKAVYGLGDNAVQTKVYNIDWLGYNSYVAVTADSCVPVTETSTGQLQDIYGGDGKTEIMQVVTFSNIKAGIANRNVFFVPAQCESQPMMAQTLGRRSLFFR